MSWTAPATISEALAEFSWPGDDGNPGRRPSLGRVLVHFAILFRIRHDGTVGRNEIAGHADSLFDDAARVVTQVEDELVHALLAELGKFLGEIVSRAITEDGHADIADVRAVDHLAGDCRHVDLAALDGKGLFFAIAADDEVDAGVDRSADVLGHIFQLIALDGRAINGHQDITALETPSSAGLPSMAPAMRMPSSVEAM